jgi:ABC-2 type transport system permease protein
MSGNATEIGPQSAPAPLWLLVRVNVLQLWRRLLFIRKQSKLLTTIIGLFIGSYLVLSFGLFYRGLKYLTLFPGLGTVLMERLLYLLFAFLFALLLLSNLILSYSNLFRNREAIFLLTMPVSSQTILRWKFIESTLLASWAFLFLIAPMLAAFGLIRHVPWHFYMVTLVLIALFIVLPGVAGSWMAICIGRYLDRRSFQIAVITTALALLTAAAFWWKTQFISNDMPETRTLDVMDKLLVRTKFATFPFLPGYWLTSSVVQWADGALAAAGFFTLVLLSHALFFGFLAFTGWGNLFYDTASAVQSRGRVWGQWKWWTLGRVLESRGVQGPLEKIVNRLLALLSCDTRALVVKDVRVFWRDTTQWGQSVMLFGLLGIYIINLRSFSHQLTSPFWINLISYLNLAACSLNLATVTTRFVFPQFSLEGQRLWIIGMSPMGMAKVVKVKYWLASALSLVVTLSLITLSCRLLKLSWERTALFGGMVVVMTFALNGLAVGLGVLYPNFKDANPGKIVSGFGGTLCLVLSFLYIVASVLLLSLGTNNLFSERLWTMTSVTIFALISLVVGWLPLRLGLKRAGNFEV